MLRTAVHHSKLARASLYFKSKGISSILLASLHPDCKVYTQTYTPFSGASNLQPLAACLLPTTRHSAPLPRVSRSLQFGLNQTQDATEATEREREREGQPTREAGITERGGARKHAWSNCFGDSPDSRVGRAGVRLLVLLAAAAWTVVCEDPVVAAAYSSRRGTSVGSIVRAKKPQLIEKVVGRPRLSEPVGLITTRVILSDHNDQ